MESVMNAIRSIRNRRAEMNVPPSKKSTLYVVSDKGEIFRQGTGFICRLAYADQVIICDADPEGHENMVCVVTNDASSISRSGGAHRLREGTGPHRKAKRRTASSRSPCSRASFPTKHLSPRTRKGRGRAARKARKRTARCLRSSKKVKASAPVIPLTKPARKSFYNGHAGNPCVSIFFLEANK